MHKRIHCERKAVKGVSKMAEKATTKTVTTIRLDPGIKEAAERAAAADARTLSSLIQKVLGDWLKDHKFIR
jgi:hypothetical protein